MKKNALRAAKKMVETGFQHHDYYQETETILAFLRGDEKAYKKYLSEFFVLYADVLGPTQLRALKNGIICSLTLLSRQAIMLGGNPEICFGLSDFFIGEVEKCNSRGDLTGLVREIFEEFSTLTYSDMEKHHSYHVEKAIRFIRLNIYAPFQVKDIVHYLGLNPNYFSTIFKNEVGMTAVQYVRDLKMEEATHLLLQGNYNITEISEMIGYCNVSYFSSEFKRTYGMSPKAYVRDSAK